MWRQLEGSLCNSDGLLSLNVWLFLLVFIFHLGFVRVLTFFPGCILLLVAGTCKMG